MQFTQQIMLFKCNVCYLRSNISPGSDSVALLQLVKCEADYTADLEQLVFYLN